MPASTAGASSGRRADDTPAVRRLELQVADLNSQVARLQAERTATSAGSALIGVATMSMAALGLLLALFALLRG